MRVVSPPTSMLSSVRLARSALTLTTRLNIQQNLTRMASTSTPSPPVYPKARRDEDRVEKYQSKARGKVDVKDRESFSLLLGLFVWQEALQTSVNICCVAFLLGLKEG